MTKHRGLPFPVQIVLGILVILMATVCGRLAFRHFYRAVYPVDYREIVEEQSRLNGLPPALVYAVIHTESGFNPQASSHVDARGLMQITEETFQWVQYRIGEAEDLHFDDLYDAELNIRYGAALLRLLLEEFGSVENALCAYHTGWGNLKKWLADPALSADGVNIGKIPSRVTAYYVDRVMDTQAIYERLYNF